MSVQLAQCTESEFNFLKGLVESRNVKQPEKLISNWIEGRRIYPQGAPFPGPHRNRRTPYAVEILDNMSFSSPIRTQSIMKGVQLGFTTSAENIIGYFIGECPTEIIYVSATESLLEKWSTKRLEPMIDSMDLRKKIVSVENSPKAKRTGDKTFSKNFIGGSLNLASAQSASSLRSDSKRVVIVDEEDGAPRDLRTGEGNFLDVVIGRAAAWDGREKIMDFSSPTEYQTSLVWERYNLGDKRRFMVPCPYCKKKQWLDHDLIDKGNHGLRGDYEAGILKDAYYLCEFCHEAIFNHHKINMLLDGDWEPQTFCDPARRSYQISSLYSPAGMFSWRSYYEKYQEALKKENGLRSFTNLYMGMPYRESGARPKVENVIELRGSYDRGFIPNNVLFLTMGLDVQRGSDKDKENPARIEMEVLGHGMGYKTWSIDYFVFEGAVDDPESGAWAKLAKFAEDGGLHFKNKVGLEYSPVSIFMDANDNFSTAAVYEFSQKWSMAMPIRGAGVLKKRKSEAADTVDESKAGNVKRFRFVKADNDIGVVMINTSYYKNALYRRLKVSRVDGDQRPGFCEFPISYQEEYFKMLTAEEKTVEGAFVLASGRRNEALDCRVYAMCAADVYLDARVTELKTAAKNRGAKPYELSNINSKTVLELLKQRIK